MTTKEIILSYLSEKLKPLFDGVPENFFTKAQEVRFRSLKPLIIVKNGAEYTITCQKKLTRDISKGYIVLQTDISAILDLISGRSMYAFSDELKEGFITINGGHRVGVSGKVISSGGEIRAIKHFNSLNIRLSHQIIGCADPVMRSITSEQKALHTMIISPPACGKTTLLRDIIRQLSNDGQTVAIVDERSEVAGCVFGVPQNDVGIRTDVLDGCKKAEGMLMLLRSMSPKVIAVDEIGKNEDVHAIEDIINAGVTIICTVHGKSIEDIKKKPVLRELIEKGIFKRFIVLKKPGEIEGIYTDNYERCVAYAAST